MTESDRRRGAYAGFLVLLLCLAGALVALGKRREADRDQRALEAAAIFDSATAREPVMLDVPRTLPERLPPIELASGDDGRAVDVERRLDQVERDLEAERRDYPEPLARP